MFLLPALNFLLDSFAHEVREAHPVPLVPHDLLRLTEQPGRDSDMEPLVGLLSLPSARHKAHLYPQCLYCRSHVGTNVTERVRGGKKWITVRVPVDLATRLDRAFPDPWMPRYGKIQELLNERDEARSGPRPQIRGVPP